MPESGSLTYYAQDTLGTNVVILPSTAGSPCYDADYYPFGGEREYVSTCAENYKFEGKKRDQETGNDDFGARYYASWVGRWESPDWSSTPEPVPYANLTNPQTLNLFTMVSDNPETFADLNGHDDGTTTSTPEYHAYGQAYNGYGAASVTVTQTTTATTTTTAADGTKTTTQTVTKTTTTAYFSLKDGSYQGATQTVDKTVYSNGMTDTSPGTPSQINKDQATSAIGYNAMANAAKIAEPGFATGFVDATKNDAKNHPLKYAAAGYAIGELFYNPPKGLRDATDVIIPAALEIGDYLTSRDSK